jgi:integrase/recombinase XerC
LDDDISRRLVPPKTEQKEPRVLTKREYTALIRACAHHPRDSAIIELLLQTGTRLSEVARLTLDDVELPKRISRSPDTLGRLHVIGKGRKDRWIPLNYKACRALRTWLNVRPEVEHDALFVSKFKEPLGARSIQHVVKKHLHEAGIKGASVHTLRHTFATHHVAQGTSLRTVQEILGHADLKTTSIYVQLAQEVVRKELQEHAL